MRVIATYDGEVFRPDEAVDLPPNTRVTLTVSTPSVHTEAEEKPDELNRRPKSFIETALALRAEGPKDLSMRIDEYLYGDVVSDEE